MKQITNDLKAIIKDLERLSRKTEGMKKRLEKLEKAQAKKKKAKSGVAGKVKTAKKAAAKKTPKASASKTLFEIIQKSRNEKGVDTTMLKQETGFPERKIWNVINSLKSQGKIKSAGRGYYKKA